ncbi:hypothetical protein ABMB67_003577 [Halalkalibacter oceani]
MKRGESVAPEIDFAFRGKLVSLLGLPPCGVSPLLFLPQESPSISSARHSGKYSSCIFRMVFRVHGSKTKHRLHGICFEDSSDPHSDWSCTHGSGFEAQDRDKSFYQKSLSTVSLLRDFVDRLKGAPQWHTFFCLGGQRYRFCRRS